MAWYIDGSISMGNLDVFATDKALGDYRVCMIDCDDETVSEQDLAANARLIAAAPDLLAALIELDAWAMNESGAVCPDGTFEIVRAAIAKAKGADV